MAKRKEVLLIQDVLKLGNMGDLVRVSPGYARNYLFPYGMAIPAGEAAKRQIEVLREKASKSEADREQKALKLKKSMEGMSIQIAARVAHETELFGSIGTKDIVAALAKSGIDVDGKQVHLHDKLRRLGSYSVDVRLHKNVTVAIKLEIVNADPNAPALTEALAQVVAEKDQKTAEAKDAKAGKGDAKDAKPDGKSDAKGAKPESKGAKADVAKAGKDAKPAPAGKPEAGSKKTVKA